MATHLAAGPAVETQVPVRIPHLNRILVPIDFSQPATAALCRAIDIARIYHSSILLVHVMTHQTENGMATILPGALLKLETDLQHDLDYLKKQVTDYGIPCAALLRKGSVTDNVQDLLREHGIDLLVLATHGGHGIHGVFLGSTAEHLIRHTTVPVITVGSAPNQPAWDEHGASHILFAGNFDPRTVCGLSLALGIQKTTGAMLSVVQAMPPGSSPHEIARVREHIQALVAPGTPIYTPVGPTGRVVCALAREIGAGIIALGVHRVSIAREIFGTGLLEILLNAPCPVLSVRECD